MEIQAWMYRAGDTPSDKYKVFGFATSKDNGFKYEDHMAVACPSYDDLKGFLEKIISDSSS